MKRIFLFLLFVLLCPAISHAATCYAVTPSGAGAKNGTNWSNAYAGLPSSLSAGGIYYLADGSYGKYSLSSSGSSGSKIEIRKAQSFDYGQLSNCSSSIAAGWSVSTMGSAQAVFASYQQFSISGSYTIINGNSQQTGYGCGGNPGANQNSAPSNPADCGIKVDDTTCSGDCLDPIGLSASNVTLEAIEFAGIGNATNENYIIFVTGSSNLITHMYMHNAGAVMILYQPGSNNNTESYNYLWGLEQTLGSNPNHGQFIQVNGGLSNLLDERNVYRDGAGTAVFSTVGSGAVTGWVIFDNVFVYTPGFSPTYPYSDGIVSCISESCALLFYDNTEVGVTGNTGVNNEASGGNVTVTDNLYYGGHMPSYGGGQPITNSYNSFLASGSSCPSGTANVCDNSSPNPFVNWQGNNFNLASENADWTNRIALPSPYTTDMNGTTFSTDRGAYQFGTSSGSVTLTPSSQTFSSSYVGVQSSPNYTFTLNNTTSSSDTGVTPSITGTNPGDYAIVTNNCPTTVTASNNCTIIVSFTPTAVSSRVATLSVAGSAPGSPQTASLLGTGLATSVTTSPATLAFGNVLQSTPSSVMNATITNNSGGSITIGAITFTGTNGSDFTRSVGNPGTCSTTLTNTSSCTVGVVFTPTGSPVDNETATLNIAYTGFTGSPATVALTGTSVATAPPAAPTGLTCTAS
jgi:hypothetical protein